MSTNPRRSTRIAEKQAVKAAEDTLPKADPKETKETKEKRGKGSDDGGSTGPSDDDEDILGALSDVGSVHSERRHVRPSKAEDLWEKLKVSGTCLSEVSFVIVGPQVAREGETKTEKNRSAVRGATSSVLVHEILNANQ